MMRTSGGAGPLYDAVRVERSGSAEPGAMLGLRFAGLPHDLAVACRNLMARSETGKAPFTPRDGYGRLMRDIGGKAMEFAPSRTHVERAAEDSNPHFGLMPSGAEAGTSFVMNMSMGSTKDILSSWALSGAFAMDFAAAASRGKVEWADGEAVEL